MAISTKDNAIALDATVGPHPTDIFSLESENLGWAEQLTEKLPESVIWSPTMGFSNVDKEIMSHCENAINKLADAGVKIIERIYMERKSCRCLDGILGFCLCEKTTTSYRNGYI